MVDEGYGLTECLTRAKVIDTMTVKALFGGTNENLLVELPGGERKWIGFWTETSQAPETLEVRCPSTSRFNGDLVGCGSTNVFGPDEEGLYDCADCGLFFNDDHRSPNSTSEIKK